MLLSFEISEVFSCLMEWIPCPKLVWNGCRWIGHKKPGLRWHRYKLIGYIQIALLVAYHFIELRSCGGGHGRRNRGEEGACWYWCIWWVQRSPIFFQWCSHVQYWSCCAVNWYVFCATANSHFMDLLYLWWGRISIKCCEEGWWMVIGLVLFIGSGSFRGGLHAGEPINSTSLVDSAERDFSLKREAGSCLTQLQIRNRNSKPH